MATGNLNPAGVVVGTSVAWFIGSSLTLGRCVRLTATQIIVHDESSRETRFNRKTGMMRGDHWTPLLDPLDGRVVTARARRTARRALDDVERLSRGTKLGDTVECLSVLSDAAGLLDRAAKEINALLTELDRAQARRKGDQ